MLRGFLIKLSSLDGQLLDNNGEYALLHPPPPSPLRDFDADFRIEECTFAVIIETNDDLAPSSNSTEVSPSSWAFTSSRLLTFFFFSFSLFLLFTNPQETGPWVPALAADTLRPSQKEDAECPEKHEPLLSVKAIETGVIDVRLSSSTHEMGS